MVVVRTLACCRAGDLGIASLGIRILHGTLGFNKRLVNRYVASMEILRGYHGATVTKGYPIPESV